MHAQCLVRFSRYPDSIIFIRTVAENPSDFESLEEQYYDEDFGDIIININTSLIFRLYNIKYMNFVLVVGVSSLTHSKHFVPTAVVVEFTDHYTFELKSDTLLYSDYKNSLLILDKSLNIFFAIL